MRLLFDFMTRLSMIWSGDVSIFAFSCRPEFDTDDSDDSSTTYNINLGCIGKPLVFMAAEAVVFLVLAVVIQV